MGKTKKKKIVIPQFINSPLNNPMPNYSVYYMTKAEKLLCFTVLFIVGGLVGYVFYGGLFKVDGEPTTATTISNTIVFVAVGIAAVKVFVPAIVNMLKNNRAKKLRKQFVDFLECLSASLSSGNTMHGAMINARADLMNQYSEKDFIIIELCEIINGVENGMNMEEMLQSFGVRSANEDIMNFSNVISNCYRLGGNFGDVVRKTRDIISDKIMVEDEIETKITSNKLQLNAMSFMPIVLVGLLKMSNPDFADNLASFSGILVTTFAVGLFVVSYFWGRKIIDIG